MGRCCNWVEKIVETFGIHLLVKIKENAIKIIINAYAMVFMVIQHLDIFVDARRTSNLDT